jgi:hypothetical protein
LVLKAPNKSLSRAKARFLKFGSGLNTLSLTSQQQHRDKYVKHEFFEPIIDIDNLTDSIELQVGFQVENMAPSSKRRREGSPASSVNPHKTLKARRIRQKTNKRPDSDNIENSLDHDDETFLSALDVPPQLRLRESAG